MNEIKIRVKRLKDFFVYDLENGAGITGLPIDDISPNKRHDYVLEYIREMLWWAEERAIKEAMEKKKV